MDKKLIFLIITIWVGNYNCIAQDSLQIKKNFQKIVKLIRADSISELANLINFPLSRPNPIPDISTSHDFILYAPILLDSSFKIKLLSYNDSDVFEHHGYYGLVGGLFSGDIWMDENGMIRSINYHSAAELKLQTKLTHEVQNKIYPSVKMWKENILVCETNKFLIRVDLMDDDSLRYVAWSKPKTIVDKPDLILSNGVQEFQGTMGGVTYTFKNNEYYYQVDEVDIAESDDQTGLFLRIFKNKKDLENFKELVSYRCQEMK
jgi:hypothetical protein